MKQIKNKHNNRLLVWAFAISGAAFLLFGVGHASAQAKFQAHLAVPQHVAEIKEAEFKTDRPVTTNSSCGSDDTKVETVIDIGCKGKGNGILDATFAIIRFLTLGASLVIIASTIAAGIQFTSSRGDPQATSAAMKRIASNFSALLLFIFAYAILNWLVPNTILK